MAQQVESYRVVVLSTGHLTKQDSDGLSQASKRSDMIFERDTGFFIKLYTDQPDLNFDLYDSGISDHLKNIVCWALEEGFNMIEFDSDGDCLDMFPLRDW